MKAELMKKVGRKMAIRMGLLMSFALALTGTLSSGHFTIVSFLISFVISTVLSIIIGFIIPVGKISQDACRKSGFEPASIKGRLLQSLISDLIYTPLMTLFMVSFAYLMIIKNGAKTAPPFIPMFLKSFVICMIVGYILIFIFMPMFLMQIMKKEGIINER